ncbi:amphoterin-induced protein 3 [Perognathus longimembris pacificus]|uniref:amphoterin-induced protein 3 n=1 Tax=Perognathus longimembris pacificus TaxID=214514 RepID=UPI00201922AA|nr:amphoterin-induced protein 3 [Perognathus longimembris pacificus]
MARLLPLGALLCALRAGPGAADPEPLPPRAPHHCPARCVCAADVLSCAGLGLGDPPAALPPAAADLDLSHNALRRLRPGWLAPLPRLRALRLGHNRLDALGRRVFANASGLALLDLSSNALHALGRHDLDGLGALERLLLFNNCLAQLDARSFHGLPALRHLYLGANRLAAFSFLHLHGLGAAHLRTLDLSSNRLGPVSVPALAALPTFLKNGLYLHDNPLPCDCRLLRLLQRWHQRGLAAVRDFARHYTCRAFPVPGARVRFLEHRRLLDNCSAAAAPGPERPEEQLAAQVGRPLRLRCNASAPAARVAWVSPQHELLVAPGSRDGSIAVRADGSLAIASVQPRHAGVFACLAAGPRLPHGQALEYNVSVHFPRPAPEAFNTGFTTLLGCAVGLALVLLYLFAPPCRGRCRPCRRPCRGRCPPCGRRRGPRSPSPLRELSAQSQSSVLSATPPDAPRKAGAPKHVVFLEPGRGGRGGRGGLGGRVQLAVAEDFDLCPAAGLPLRAGSETASSTGSDGPLTTQSA